MQRLASTQYEESDGYDEWWKRSDEEVIIKVGKEFDGLPDGFSFFDSIYDSEFDKSYGKFSISDLSLREISEAYQFSIPYLGDFVVQLGCKPPIDVDTKIGNILVGEQIFSLLEAINTLDPVDSHWEYDSVTLNEIADELDTPLSALLKICQKEGINLPFGLDTVLHKSVANRIRDIKQFDEYVDIEKEEDKNSLDNIYGDPFQR